MKLDEIAAELGVGLAGLRDQEAAERLRRFGANRIDPPAPTAYWKILLRQFKSPLIYVLLVAGSVALFLGEIADATFIGAVLVLNSLIGFVNEFRADREVQSLSKLVTSRARVHREGRVVDVTADEIVPGDLLVVEGGARIVADMRLVSEHDLRVDESLLSGESLPVEKNAKMIVAADTPLADRRNMVFAGSMATSGRALGLAVATGQNTELGEIAVQLGGVISEPPPLLRRMEVFARRVGLAALVLCGALVLLGTLRGQPLSEVLLSAIALAVSAIPEGLPVALTVALAVAVSRMARRGVVVRNLPAVEALGSCGVIGTDKTGTLTRNQLTVERVIAGALRCDVTGVGYVPEGELICNTSPVVMGEEQRLFRIARAVCLANEASLSLRKDGSREYEWSGDPTDVALLAFAIKAGIDPLALAEAHELVAVIPFESEHRYMASFHCYGEAGLTCVKGAPERVIAMCDLEPAATGDGYIPVDREAALKTVEEMMTKGYRVLAVAEAESREPVAAERTPPEPENLVFLGLVALTDPPRENVAASLDVCRKAGIRVVMITGDHPTTAASIGKRIGLIATGEQIVTGDMVSRCSDTELDELVPHTSIVARATPAEKLRVVEAFQRRGDFVAVTGDGVNDAPALRRADIGVAMGRDGADVAREAADLVITNDDFSSIVAGIEEGRFAYDNVRKVTYLLVSTGVGEVVAVTGALALGLPIPFTAVQLLWLNLVTNGIQDVALAFEPGEPGALERPPRPPSQGLFDRLMLERTLLAGGVFGLVGLGCFFSWIEEGRSVADARNLLVQLFVLFEILHIGNSRSEVTSIFRLNAFSNPILFFGTLAALAVHIAALYTPVLQSLLDVQPIALRDFVALVGLASSIVVVMEIHKAWRRRRPLT